MQKSKLIKPLFLIAGMVVLFLLNYFLLQDLIIPDPCAYHGKDPNFIMKIFYSFNSGADNGHPFPTVINFAVTLFVGYHLGKLSFEKWNNRQQARVN